VTHTFHHTRRTRARTAWFTRTFAIPAHLLFLVLHLLHSTTGLFHTLSFTHTTPVHTHLPLYLPIFCRLVLHASCIIFAHARCTFHAAPHSAVHTHSFAGHTTHAALPLHTGLVPAHFSPMYIPSLLQVQPTTPSLVTTHTHISWILLHTAHHHPCCLT